MAVMPLSAVKICQVAVFSYWVLYWCFYNDTVLIVIIKIKECLLIYANFTSRGIFG